MITIGTTADRIGYKENGNEKNSIYLSENSSKTYLYNKDNIPYFDENNINTTITDSNVIKTEHNSFINDKKFYTCSANGQTSLCFRCVNNCVLCVDCHACDNCYGECNNCDTCNANCHGRDGCNSCNNCDNCHDCVRCNTCTTCASCVGSCYIACNLECVDYNTQKGCATCTACQGNCTSCNGPSNSCNNCYGCNNCTKCVKCVSSCNSCNSKCFKCTDCVGCWKKCYSGY